MEENKISSDLIRGHIDTIILYSLTDSDKFAQQISDFIEEKSEKKYQINQATLYSSLKRLETLKLVSSYRYDCEGGRRKYFKITELGNEFVKENLSNWSYSRVIIDKLMGCEYTPHIYVTQNNSEKTLANTSEIKVEENQNTTNQIQANSLESFPQSSTEKDGSSLVKDENTAVKDDSPPIPTPSFVDEEKLDVKKETDENFEEKKEINFRNILNGLIKSAEKSIKPELEVKPKIEITDLGKETPEKPEDKQDQPIVPKFNETIEKTTYSTKPISVGKADFSDLVEKYRLEGYKIRVSSKGSAKIVGNLLLNKLKFFSMLCFMVVPLIEFLLMQFVANVSIFSSIPATIALVLTVASFLAVTFVYFSSRNKTVYKTINADGILISGIIVFNLLLVTFALNFVLSVDLSIKFNLISYLIVPIVTSINLILYYVIELLMYKTGKFKVKLN